MVVRNVVDKHTFDKRRSKAAASVCRGRTGEAHPFAPGWTTRAGDHGWPATEMSAG